MQSHVPHLIWGSPILTSLNLLQLPSFNFFFSILLMKNSMKRKGNFMKVSWDNRTKSCPILIRMWILLSLIILSYYKFDNKDNLPKKIRFLLFVFQEKLSRSICIWDSHDNVLCDFHELIKEFNKRSWQAGAQPLWSRAVRWILFFTIPVWGQPQPGQLRGFCKIY